MAAELGVWLLIGSLCLKSGEADGRFVNRSFLIGPDGAIRARYDKIHMFDVALAGGESYREVGAYRPGERAVLAEAAGLRLGMTVCYDLRFPQLYRDLAQAGAEVLSVPSAFTVPTGRGALARAAARPRDRDRGLRARPGAVGDARGGERAGAADLWPQPGGLALGRGAGRRGRGRSGVAFVEVDPAEVARARAMVPSLGHDRDYAPPDAPMSDRRRATRWSSRSSARSSWSRRWPGTA